ncbi:hypothetical protein [Oceanidesulfovibrio marinus]|uniref:Uncharacterized protein n=1 Tax=Oceanidesulfovibrio marinus TaxID=370038 RepID=A0A6P1ZIC1_9BACT|nr:hypothetical protein [Oceanidesulfovibrio marinus]QJT07896.1 hypothetical protein E8L03_02675 [Oceanidesulfovibrio marinus]TVM33396.1 hypothetical protein DQK91_12080 [Oceanidesulfovibrio marinus]
MRKPTMFLIVLSLLVLCSAPAFAAGNTTVIKDNFDLRLGFQGYPWGVSPENLEGFRKIGTKNNADFYICPCVTYLLEDVTVPRVVYGFVNDQLYGVFIDIDKDDVFDKVLKYITKKFGKPEVKEEANEHVHRWNVGEVKIKLKDDLATGKRKLSLYYSPLSRTVKLSPFRKSGPEDEPQPMNWTPPMKPQKPVAIPLLSF